MLAEVFGEILGMLGIFAVAASVYDLARPNSELPRRIRHFIFFGGVGLIIVGVLLGGY